MSGWYTETYTADKLAKKIKKKELTVPPYQRGQVWVDKQEELFIDSIKSQFPFGSILLYKKEENQYQLIDGLQRITTICRYLNNPTKFFKKTDLDDEFLNDIYKEIGVSGNEVAIKEKISESLEKWLKTYKTMSDIKDLNYNDATKKLIEVFPTLATPDAIFSVSSTIKKKFDKFVKECEELSESEIPAIIYEGDAENLPTIFMRINSKGTHLSKYQILAATWTDQTYKIIEPELTKIVEYVNKFYQTLVVNDFSVVGFSEAGLLNCTELNVYQIVFGFGKLLTEKYPLLFGKTKEDKDVDSCSFNLINACLGNKNNKLKDLASLFKKCFKTDEEVNLFLKQVLLSVDIVNKYMKPYLSFKLNSRIDNKIHLYHTEMQICSMISNVHNAAYLEFVKDDNQVIIGRKVLLGHRHQSFDQFRKEFKKNALRRYIVDILNGVWSGTGDKKMDDISVNATYYTSLLEKEYFEKVLDHWYMSINANRKEYSKVKQPENAEKLLLSIIYLDKFNAFEALSDLKYDIEHLATKGLMKAHLKKFASDENARLPISSFANLCILPENQNRSKKEKTIYMDTNYIKKVINQRYGNKILTLKELEDRFTFTKKEDLEWCECNFESFGDLKNAYISFLDNRYELLKKMIIVKLYG